MSDPIHHPTHYTSHPSGVECIEITEHMNFCVGNAVKYLWRAGLKPACRAAYPGVPVSRRARGAGRGDALEDLLKARWYVDREISRLRRSYEKRGRRCRTS